MDILYTFVAFLSNTGQEYFQTGLKPIVTYVQQRKTMGDELLTTLFRAEWFLLMEKAPYYNRFFKKALITTIISTIHFSFYDEPRFLFEYWIMKDGRIIPNNFKGFWRCPDLVEFFRRCSKVFQRFRRLSEVPTNTIRAMLYPFQVYIRSNLAIFTCFKVLNVYIFSFFTCFPYQSHTTSLTYSKAPRSRYRIKKGSWMK